MLHYWRVFFISKSNYLPYIYIYIYFFLLTVPSKMVFKKCPIEIYSSLILTQIELRARWGSFGMTCYFFQVSTATVVAFCSSITVHYVKRCGWFDWKALKRKRKEAHIRGSLLEGDGSRSGRWLRKCWGSAFFLQQSCRCVSCFVKASSRCWTVESWFYVTFVSPTTVWYHWNFVPFVCCPFGSILHPRPNARWSTPTEKRL